MPEKNRPPRYAERWTLSKAHDAGQLIRIRCYSCHARRLYRPSDLKELLGNRDRDSLTRGMRCEKCGNKELHCEFWSPTAAELQGQTVRRLVAIKILRRPVWRDEPA